MKNVFILFLIISVSVAEILPGSNGIGYDYPKPNIPFETGFIKKLAELPNPTKPTPLIEKKVVDIPKPTYLPPVTTPNPPVTTTKPKPTTTRPKVVVEKKEESDGYKYPAPEVRLVLPTKPSPVVVKKVVEIPKPTYLPPVTTKKVVETPKPTYLPPVTTTKPPVTKTKPKQITRPKVVEEKKEESDGYKYPAPEVRLKLPTDLF